MLLTSSIAVNAVGMVSEKIMHQNLQSLGAASSATVVNASAVTFGSDSCESDIEEVDKLDGNRGVDGVFL